MSTKRKRPVRFVGEAAAETLREHWSGRSAVLLWPSFTRTARTVLEELTACGATVAGVVTATDPDAVPPAVPYVFSCAERGLDVSPRDFYTWLDGSPPALGSWLEQVDPDRTWTALGDNFLETGDLHGRPVHGWRRPAWSAWEDKTRVEALWQATGVPSPRHVVTRADDPALSGHVRDLDRGSGVVVAIDSSRAHYGNATGLRWVRDPHGDPRALAEALRWAGERARTVRVAEFVEGTPCSVLGLVLADGVAVFDPIEIVTLRDRDSARLTFCGSSTRWRPDPAVADGMREHVRRAGHWLAANAGFRGMFSVDGLLADGRLGDGRRGDGRLGEHGFVATELNPRQASGLGLRAAWPDFPGYLFQRAVQEAVPGVADLPWQDVETQFRDAIRRRPSHSVTIPVPVEADRGSCAKVIARGHEQVASFRSDGHGVRLIVLDPPTADGLYGPGTAALARRLGRPDLESPTESAPASPAADRPESPADQSPPGGPR
ncbi:hypothetical protein PUR71_08475 [Streptomyces sp. SP17BM10]|uniref:hypothetical protein n=1 Tax=Streptomyces sp. SP17BM10 TaxID=3002530 RepID=UPI002E797A2C|nr:hypothetical protein [Streptomyces sp. SP17BM10]MEE1782950.1 hypothetical protein [Streptomyces sp. SP17BM10]